MSARPVPQLVHQYGFDEAEFMPIRLKDVLKAHQISQQDLASHIRQSGGRKKGETLSGPMMNLILNLGIFPKTTPEEEVKAQILVFLRAKGVPEHRLTADLWRSDDVTEDPPQKKMRDRGASPDPAQQSDVFTLPEIEMLSQEAKRHFQLFRDPFLDDVQGPEDVFLDENHRYIREAMFQAAKHGGFIAVIGESGAGKTVLRKDLIERVARDKANITILQPLSIDKTRLNAAHISDAIIGDMSSQSPKRTMEAKTRQIYALLKSSSRAGNAHVLLIEEAHDLPIQTLKYLKRFWEMEDGFKRLMGIILIGQPELKAKLDERVNWEAREVIRRCEIAELRPIDKGLEAYLQLKFRRINADISKVLAPNAYQAIRDRLAQPIRGSTRTISQIYPLVINNCLIRAMNLAAEIGAPLVDADVIRAI